MKCSPITLGALEVCEMNQIEMVSSQKWNLLQNGGNNGVVIYKPEEATYEHPTSEG